MFVKAIFFLLLLLDVYLIIWFCYHTRMLSQMALLMKQKNQGYYQKALKEYQKHQKLKMNPSFWDKTILKIHQTAHIPHFLCHPLFLFLTALLCFLLCFFLAYSLLKMFVLSMMIALPAMLFPFYLLEIMREINSLRAEKLFLNFLLQLKNYTDINNDIVIAMQEVKVPEPLQSMVHQFLMEIKSGIPFEMAMVHFSKELDSQTMQNFFLNLTHCYLYGGDFSLLITKSYDMILKLQKEKEKRISETKSARMVLWILIALDLLVYFTNIKNNYEHFLIMRKTIIGNVILYWNFISLWLFMFLSYQVKKLDD